MSEETTPPHLHSKLSEPPSFKPPLPAYGERFDLYLERFFSALFHHMTAEHTYFVEVLYVACCISQEVRSWSCLV
jgi:hypothetical protein